MPVSLMGLTPLTGFSLSSSLDSSPEETEMTKGEGALFFSLFVLLLFFDSLSVFFLSASSLFSFSFLSASISRCLTCSCWRRRFCSTKYFTVLDSSSIASSRLMPRGVRGLEGRADLPDDLRGVEGTAIEGEVVTVPVVVVMVLLGWEGG